MKSFIILAALLFVTYFCDAQKYVLIDETMVAPLIYTNDVSLKNTYKNIFVVETNRLKEFVSALDKISNYFVYGNKIEDLNFIIGNTKIICIPITTRKEERLDIIIKTYTMDTDVSMHLSDTKIANVQNLFFINSWIKYIKSYTK